MALKGSKTEKNLLTAFAGESQARNRYSYFSSQARKEGYRQIADIFEETSNQEREHAKRLFKQLQGGTAEIQASFPAGIIGTTAASKFPVADFAIVTYDDTATVPPSSVDLGNGQSQQITQALQASVGLTVQRSGSTTGLHDGTVTGLNATVNYGNGDIVNGLIQTDVCAEPGDSGGPLFAGDGAVGQPLANHHRAPAERVLDCPFCLVDSDAFRLA